MDSSQSSQDRPSDLLSPEALRYAAAVIDAYNDQGHIAGDDYVYANDLTEYAVEIEKMRAKDAENEKGLDELADQLTGWVNDGYDAKEVARAASRWFSLRQIRGTR